MKVVLSSEFTAFSLKNLIFNHLVQQGHEVMDVGQTSEEEKILYPEAAARLAKTIQSGQAEKGILVCGTGAGVSIVANKFKGVYAVACESIFTARKIPIINHANVLALGSNVVGPGNAFSMIDIFLESTFALDETEERKEFLEGMFCSVKEIENENFK